MSTDQTATAFGAANIGRRRWSKPAHQRTINEVRRTTIDRLSQSQQSRIRRLHRILLKRPSRPTARSQLGTHDAPVLDGDSEPRRWKAAMKEVSAEGISSGERLEEDTIRCSTQYIQYITRIITLVCGSSAGWIAAACSGSSTSSAPLCSSLFASIDLSTIFLPYRCVNRMLI